jgi:hypothetical protein
MRVKPKEARFLNSAKKSGQNDGAVSKKTFNVPMPGKSLLCGCMEFGVQLYGHNPGENTP